MDRPSSAPPDPDKRRRAMSEVIRAETPTKWRLVSAFPSLRSRESKEKESASTRPLPHPSGITSERRDSTIAHESRTKKRVSLFVRRRRPLTDVAAKDVADDEKENNQSDGFRRAQSTLVKPVSADKPKAREMRRYLQYAAELDDLSFEKLKKFVRPGGIRILNKEEEVEEAEHEDLIGEICLEDFADVDDDDFEFLEEASVGEWEEIGMPRKPSLKLDSQKLRWIGNEKEFAQFFAEVGLDEWFEVESRREDSEEFQVGEEVVMEWTKDLEEHNRICGMWGSKAVRKLLDIRLMEREFKEGRRRRRPPPL
eukprot:GFKZ01005906.1.p1 GENE.GFKZ01005906.1~~GFKZ01005906.1.p1  ORF type:complete len:311 (+),score=76.75 GFKZ01005906.1:132-1064(+)